MEDLSGLDLVKEDIYAYVGDELVKVLTVNPISGSCTVARGVLDTVPDDHAESTRVWFAQGRHGTDARILDQGETASARACPITGKGELDIADAPTDTMDYDARAIRPYPPGNVQLNAEVYPDEINGALIVTWAHRDRLQQTAYIVEQDEGNIGPEAGTTYRLRIYGETGTLLRTWSGITGTRTGSIPSPRRSPTAAPWAGPTNRFASCSMPSATAGTPGRPMITRSQNARATACFTENTTENKPWQLQTTLI